VAETFRVRIEDLRVGPNVAAGANPYVIMGLVPLLKGSTQDHEPITVRPLPDGTFRVIDGRHRFIASIIAGRPDVLATLDTQEAPDP
jgi:ParB-like nuclease domain